MVILPLLHECKGFCNKLIQLFLLSKSFSSITLWGKKNTLSIRWNDILLPFFKELFGAYIVFGFHLAFYHPLPMSCMLLYVAVAFNHLHTT